MSRAALSRFDSRALLLVVALMCIAYTAIFTVTDPDLFWHLADGRYLWGAGHLAAHDIYSWTAPGHPWVMHEWLAELGLYGLWNLGGWTALIVGPALIIVASFALLAREAVERGATARWTAVAMVIAAIASHLSWGPRPLLFTLLGSAWLMWAWGAWSRGGSRALYAFPAVAYLWANLHAGFVFGLVLFWLAWFAEAAQARWGGGERGPRGLGPPALAGLVATGLTLLTPNGPALLGYPLQTALSGPQSYLIAEWASPDFHTVSPRAFALELGLLLLALAWRRKHLRWRDLVWMVALLGLGLQATRHLVLAAPLLAPLLAEHASRGVWLPALPRPRMAALNLAVLGVIGLFLAVRAAPNLDPATSARDQARQYPVALLRSVGAQGLGGGRLFNSYNWGGYLIWWGGGGKAEHGGAPVVLVSIDGRADVYGDQQLKDYASVALLEASWHSRLDSLGVSHLLLEAGSPLSQALQGSRTWCREQADPGGVAVLYARCRP